MVQAHAQDLGNKYKRRENPPANSLAVTKLLQVRRQTSASSISSDRSRSTTGFAFGKKATKKASKGNDLGLTPEEHAAITSGGINFETPLKVSTIYNETYDVARLNLLLFIGANRAKWVFMFSSSFL